MMRSVSGLFSDPDRRRALGMSLLLHALILLLIGLGWDFALPQRETETYLVIDLGAPTFREVEAPASADDAVAQDAERPSVQADVAGRPAPGTPDPSTETAGDPTAENLPPSAETPAPVAPPAPDAVAQPDRDAVEAQVATPVPAPTPLTRQTEDAVPTPAPEARVTVPEIDVPEVDPTTAQAALPVPEASPDTSRSTAILPTPDPERAQPTVAVVEPDPSVTTPEQAAVPVPDPELDVERRPIPVPDPVAEIEEQEPTETVEAPEEPPEEAAEVEVPTPVTDTPQAQAVATPSPTLAPADAQDVTAPTPVVASATVRDVETPEPALGVPGGRDALAPAVTTAAGDAQALGASPSVSVQAVRRVPVPSVQAIVRTDVDGAGPGSAATVPDPNAPVGGDASRPGQVEGDPEAAADALGLAASPDGQEGGGGSPPQPASPIVRTADTPIAVVLDNVGGYPQRGLEQASWIAEVPVEGGSTRLIAFFDEEEPQFVGPVRSARPYMIDIARGSNGVLVHVGGSPAALDLLARGAMPNLDAFAYGNLFARDGTREAPYNTYSQGSALRAAVGGLGVEPTRTLRGFRPAPPADDAARATSITMSWSGVYEDAFSYAEDQDAYRWVRQGELAVTGGGRPVYVDAVLVARIQAARIPGDTAGRLYIPIDGGPATLYWQGAVINGTWRTDDGLRFVDQDGNELLLEALKVWASFLPDYADVQVQ